MILLYNNNTADSQDKLLLFYLTWIDGWLVEWNEQKCIIALYILLLIYHIADTSYTRRNNKMHTWSDLKNNLFVQS